MIPILLLGLLLSDPAWTVRDQAYAALREKNYDAAIQGFRRALEMEPGRNALRKDLVYTLLKAGETEAARDQLEELLRSDPGDTQAALEYAYLCYETRRRGTAREVFDGLRRRGSAEADKAFRDIDTTLEEGIQRWAEAAGRDPGNFSAHFELAGLYEDRGELEQAAAHYRAAYRIRPAERSLLLDLGRVLRKLGREAESGAVFTAAARSSDARVAETARAFAPVEPAPGWEAFAEEKERATPPKEMGERSYRAGYLADALRYLSLAQEADPGDSAVTLQLGWTYNVLGRNQEALQYFDRARRSPDPEIAAESGRAYRNLRASLSRFRTTVWLFPFYSSRWNDAFSYGQLKSELRIGRLPLRPYVSLRLLGDARRKETGPLPQYFSESAFVLGGGLATTPWHGLFAWGEAGRAVRYVAQPERGRTAADYRGGISFVRGFGHLAKPGSFAETSLDSVYLSQFQNDCLLYSRNRLGWTLPGGVQAYWNVNVVADRQGQFWANFVEHGPGVRYRGRYLPQNVTLWVHLLRGEYTRQRIDPRGPNYFDLRVGFWYAFTY